MGLLENRRVFTAEETRALWDEYHSADEGTVEARVADLCEAYAGLIAVCALRLKAGLPSHFQVEDLIGEGYFGLRDAILKYQEVSGYKFEVYAMRRISGSMIDFLRRNDSVSRHFRGKYKALNRANDDLVSSLSRFPTDAEMAEYLGWSVEEVVRQTGLMEGASLSSLDFWMKQVSAEAHFFDRAEDVEDNFDISTLRGSFVGAISLLEEDSQELLRLVAEDRLTFVEIGKRLDVPANEVSKRYKDVLDELASLISDESLS